MIEDLYVISRDTTTHNINFYMTNTRDFLRENDTDNVTFVTRITASDTAGNVTHADLPYGIAPYPTVALDTANTRGAGQFMSLYIPKGKALWVGRATTSTDNLGSDTGPVVGAQGGYY